MIRKIVADTFFKNSLVLMVNSGFISLSGFLFWIVIAKYYSVFDIGVASSIYSAAVLVSTLALLGLSNGIIRFYKELTHKSEHISLLLILTTALTAVLALVSFPVLLFSLHQTFGPVITFLLFIAFFLISILSTLNALEEALLLAVINSPAILLKNSLFSLLRLLMPVLLISFGMAGLISAIVLPLLLSILLGFVLIKKMLGLVFTLNRSVTNVKEIVRYSVGLHVAGIGWSIPTFLMPLIISARLGFEATGYFSVVMMFYNLITLIPQVISQLFFAEQSGSGNSNYMKPVVKSSILISLFLFPAIGTFYFFGDQLLSLLGKNFSREGFETLRLFALSGVFVGINYIFGTVLALEKRILKTIIISFSHAAVLLGLSSVFLSQGIIGVGWAQLIGQALLSGLYLVIFGKRLLLKNKILNLAC